MSFFRVVFPLCGGNIDSTVLGRVIERGLAADGRLLRFSVVLPDRPGGLTEINKLLGDLGVRYVISYEVSMYICGWVGGGGGGGINDSLLRIKIF